MKSFASQVKLLPLQIDVESKTVLRKVASAHKALAELKGITATIPNEYILIETLTLREARESSAIENIVSTFDEVYQSNLISQQFASSEAKEVHLYADALKTGFELVRKKKLLTINHILQIHEALIQNNAGFRKLPGTKLLNDRTGEVIYTPPQDHDSIVALMKNLEGFINNDEIMDIDPLIKMAIVHHQFESIHPFYDGNGRAGRIINILYLIQKGLLKLPVLYLSRFIIQNKNKYYSLLQKVREEDAWEEWILYMLEGIEQTASGTILLVNKIRELMRSYKEEIQKELPKVYSRELLENLFKYPYTKIEYLQRDLKKSRNTVINYLDALVKRNFLVKEKRGRDNFYINQALFDLLSDKSHTSMTPRERQTKEILCKAIKERQLVRFYYESKSSGKREWRTIRPYMIIPQNANLQLVGTPIDQLEKPVEHRQAGHYLLPQLAQRLEMGQLEILQNETFDDPGVPRKIVVNTKTQVVCRFIYDDENKQEIIATWVKEK